MLGIQVSIGSLNDLVDAPEDAVAKPRKPIPAGLVEPRVAGAIAAAGGLAGVALSAVSNGWTAALVVVCAGLGYLYDVRLSRSAVSWLPLSLALPLLPVHAWVGVTGEIPTGLITLLPIGVIGGGGLALANGLVDVERDERSGKRSATTVLGRRRTWLIQTVALIVAVLLATAVVPGGGSDGAGIGLWGGLLPGGNTGSGGGEVALAGGLTQLLAWLRVAGILVGGGLIALGAGFLAVDQPALRERGWELEALGVAAIGVGWITGAAIAEGAIGA